MEAPLSYKTHLTTNYKLQITNIYNDIADVGSSLPPISSSLPKPFGDLAPPDSADEAPSESVTPVISYNLSSAAEQLSKNHIRVKFRALIVAVSMISCLYHCTFCL